MADVILFTPQRGWTLNGAPLVGGKAIFLQSGTDTEITVYSDAALTSALSQPVLANSSGVFPVVYFAGGSQVRAVIRDNADVELSDIDPVPTAPLSSGGASGITFAASPELPYSNVQNAIEGSYAQILALKSGEDENFISGTPGSASNLSQFNADGDLVDASVAVSTDGTFAASSDEKVPTEKAARTFALTGNAPSFILEDQKASGTDAGASVTGSWLTRDLNTEVRDADGIVSIASNEFTTTVACYVEFAVPFYRAGSTQARLYDVTNTAVVVYGTSSRGDTATAGLNLSTGQALLPPGTYRLEYQASNAIATGLGLATGFAGNTEIYTRVKGWRTA